MRRLLALLALLTSFPLAALAQQTSSPGNVIGAASSTDGHCALFNGTSGKKIKDGGACPGGGGGSLSNTDGTTTITGVTAQTFGNGFVLTGTSPNATLNQTVKSTTKTTSYSAAAGDMGYGLNLGGSTGTLTLPTASSTVFAPGMTLTILVSASGNWTLTNSTGLTLTGLNSTTLVPGTSGTFVANADGTHLDFYPGPQAATGAVLGSFTASGNTNKAGTVSGSLTSGNCIKSDASGNLVDAATTCGGGGGGSVFGPDGYVAGLFYTGLHAQEGGIGVVANRLYAYKFIAGATDTLTKLAVNIATLAVGGNCELTVYNSSGGIPTTLKTDGGSVSTTLTGVKTISSLSIGLTAGTSYFFAAGCDNSTTLLTGAPATDYNANYFTGTDTINAGSVEQIYGAWTFSSGAAPSTFPTVVHNTGGTPLVYIGK